MVTVHPFQGKINGIGSDVEPCFYLYEVKDVGYHCIGLVASIAIIDVLNGKILRHEETFPERIDLLFEEFSSAQVQYNPLLLITDEEGFDKKITEFSLNAQFVGEYQSANGLTHRLLRIHSKKTPFQLLKSLCIADGHHRLSALLKYYRSKTESQLSSRTMMATIFSVEHVRTRTKGIVLNYRNHQIPFFLQKLEALFEINKPYSIHEPVDSNEFWMFLSNAWYLLKLKPQFYQNDHESLLGIEIFKKYILNHIFSLSGYAANALVRIFFDICNFTSVKTHAAVNDGVGFVISSDPCTKVIDAARSGRILEANSTYFEPKLLNGLLSKQLETI